MALSSMGHSQASAQSLQSIAGAEPERKISFVLHEPENVSGGSNVTVRFKILFLSYLILNFVTYAFKLSSFIMKFRLYILLTW